MSKSAYLLAIPALLAAAWGGGTWYVGQQTETMLRAQLEKSNQLTAPQGITQNLISYEKGFLDSKAVIGLTIQQQPMNALFKDVRFNAVINNGPLLLGEGGVSAGLSRWTVTLDQNSIQDAELKALITEIFAGKEPFKAVSDIGFDKQIKSHFSVSPIKFTNQDESSKSETQFNLAGITGNSLADYGYSTGTLDLKVGAFNIIGQGATPTVSIPEMTVKANITGLVGSTMLGDSQLQANKISINPPGTAEAIGFDLLIDSKSTQSDKALNGALDLKVSNIQGAQDQVSNINYVVNYNDLLIDGVEAIGKLQSELQSAQAQIDFNSPNTDIPEAQKKTMELFGKIQDISERMLDTFLKQVLQADKTRIAQKLTVDNPKGKGQLDLDLLYKGGEPLPTLNDLMSGGYSPEQWAKLVNVSLKLNADKAMLPPIAGMMLAEPIGKGLVTEQEKQYQVNLKLAGETVDLNGKTMPIAEFLATVGGGAASNANTEDTLPEGEAASADDLNNLGLPPELAKEIEEKGLTPEIMKKIEASPDVDPAMLEMMRQMQQMQQEAEVTEEAEKEEAPAADAVQAPATDAATPTPPSEPTKSE